MQVAPHLIVIVITSSIRGKEQQLSLDKFQEVKYLITHFLMDYSINLMVSTEASWWNILNLKIYTTLSYIVSLMH